MPNVVNYAERWEPELLEIISQNTLCTPFITNNVRFLDARTFHFTSMATSGFKSHSRDGGWNRGKFTQTDHPFTLMHDRDIEFLVDKADVDESNQTASIQNIAHTPCKVSIPAGMQVNAGDIITVTDRNGVTVTAYVMTKKQSGQRDTLECTGSYRRDSSSAVNEQSYKALSGKVLDLQMNVDGLKVENRDAAGKLASLALNLDGLTAKVQGQSDDIAGIAENITQIQQNAQEVKLSIQSIREDGVEKVQTETGYTFDGNGLNISKDGSDIENRLNETGMYVKRNGEVILQANNDGVEATDVSVRNYLIIGDHARFENYSDGSDSKRTACFWI